MLNNAQFRKFIVVPALQAFDYYLPFTEELLVGTMAHESLGGAYIAQMNGPAKGIYQMNTDTHDDTWLNYLRYKTDLCVSICRYCSISGDHPDSIRMIYDMNYATAMAIVYYIRKGRPIAGDIWSIYKTLWNTAGGSATQAAFEQNYKNFCS